MRTRPSDVRPDDADLLQELSDLAEEEAFEKLDERPSHFRTLDELLIPRPDQLAADDLFLHFLGGDFDTLMAYTQSWSRPGAAVRLQDRGFVEWTQLAKAGLALRGAEVPTEALVSVYTLAELNSVLRPTKPFRRKKDVLAAVPSAILLEKLPDISKCFFLKPIPPEVEIAEEAFSWISTHARLTLDTVRTYEAVSESLQQGSVEDSWYSIYGDCCEASRKASERDMSAKPPKRLPPYHIGCDARLG